MLASPPSPGGGGAVPLPSSSGHCRRAHLVWFHPDPSVVVCCPLDGHEHTPRHGVSEERRAVEEEFEGRPSCQRRLHSQMNGSEMHR